MTVRDHYYHPQFAPSQRREDVGSRKDLVRPNE